MRSRARRSFETSLVMILLAAGGAVSALPASALALGPAPSSDLRRQPPDATVDAAAASAGVIPRTVGDTGSISGTVVQESTATPVVTLPVALYDAAGDYVGQATTESDGTYRFDGLSAGSYHLRTGSSNSYIAELYDDQPCPFLDCDVTSGTAVPVTAGTETTGIDFALERGGRIVGTVTETGTGTPLGGVEVRVFSAAGAQVAVWYSSGSGDYAVGGLPSGTYHAVAVSEDHLDELYDNVACPLGCDVTTGAGVAVTVGADTTGIDFVLDPGGAIRGTVTDATTGLPLAGTTLLLHDASGAWLLNRFAEGDGTYSIGGLPAGTYFLKAWIETHNGELYDDIHCPLPCDVTGGTPIVVTAGAETAGIDFDLVEGGVLGGTVTDATTSDPLAGVGVLIFDASGSRVERGETAADGSYTVVGLPSGTYYALTDSPTHLDELYDGIACSTSCDVTGGTPIVVTAGTETTGIDFALDPGGSISGVVTDLATADPLEDVEVILFDSVLIQGQWKTRTASDGSYSIGGLPPGFYYVKTQSSTHLGEVYDGILCPFQCDVTAGIALQASAGADTGGIDFTLVLGGSISGTVIDEATIAPLASVEVQIYDTGGVDRRSATTAADGTYAVGGLPSGTYYARASIPTHRAELYDDVPCAAGCDLGRGKGIPVTVSSETAAVDFALVLAASIAGTVTESGTATPLSGVPVTAYDALGRPARTAYTGGDGSYLVTGLATGLYRLVAGPTASHAAQIYDRLPFGCAILLGEPVVAVAGGAITGPDFALWPLGTCALPEDLTLSSMEIGERVEFAACGSITTGTGFTVGASGTAALHAGGAVVMGDGFSVEGGGALVASSHGIFPAPSGSTVYSEDFDDGFAMGWDTSNGPCDLWRLDAACTAPPSGGRTLTFSRSSPDCDYDMGSSIPAGWVRSPVIDLSSAVSSATVRLTHAWATEGSPSFDAMRLEVSADGGTSWAIVWSTHDGSSPGGFTIDTVDVSPYISPEFRMRFVFDGVDSQANDFLGWAIDEVVVTAD